MQVLALDIAIRENGVAQGDAGDRANKEVVVLDAGHAADVDGRLVELKLAAIVDDPHHVLRAELGADLEHDAVNFADASALIIRVHRAGVGVVDFAHCVFEPGGRLPPVALSAAAFVAVRANTRAAHDGAVGCGPAAARVPRSPACIIALLATGLTDRHALLRRRAIHVDAAAEAAARVVVRSPVATISALEEEAVGANDRGPRAALARFLHATAIAASNTRGCGRAAARVVRLPAFVIAFLVAGLAVRQALLRRRAIPVDAATEAAARVVVRSAVLAVGALHEESWAAHNRGRHSAALLHGERRLVAGARHETIHLAAGNSRAPLVNNLPPPTVPP